MKPGKARPIHGIIAIEAVRQTPGVLKWLDCVHTQPEGNDCPQSFSM